MSGPVKIAYTPGTAAARVVSMPRTGAWGHGLRTNAACAMAGTTTSSTYRPCPLSRRRSSTLRTRAPTNRPMICSRIVRPSRGGGQLGHGFGDTLEDRCVSRATTQVAGELLFDLRRRRRRVVRQQAPHRHEESRCAERALECVALPHRLLDEPQAIIVAERLDGLDDRSLRLHRQHQAGPDGLTVDRHRARTTHTVLATEMRAGEPEVVPKQFGQSRTTLDHRALFPTVDPEGDLRHQTPARSVARAAASASPRRVSTPATCALYSDDAWASAGGRKGPHTTLAASAKSAGPGTLPSSNCSAAATRTGVLATPKNDNAGRCSNPASSISSVVTSPTNAKSP